MRALVQGKKEAVLDLETKVGCVVEGLDRLYPEARCALHYRDAWELLVATVLSAQCTDERVNRVTPGLFASYPDPYAMARADPQELEEAIRPTGFFRNKARNLRKCAAVLVERYGGRVPRTLEELVQLPGIGRKTANLILGEVYGVPGVVVDTHVLRVARRLGLTRNKDAVKVEFDLMELFPKEQWTRISHQLIWHGRRVCTARKPRCGECLLRACCDFHLQEGGKD